MLTWSTSAVYAHNTGAYVIFDSPNSCAAENMDAGVYIACCLREKKKAISLPMFGAHPMAILNLVPNPICYRSSTSSWDEVCGRPSSDGLTFQWSQNCLQLKYIAEHCVIFFTSYRVNFLQRKNDIEFKIKYRNDRCQVQMRSTINF